MNRRRIFVVPLVLLVIIIAGYIFRGVLSRWGTGAGSADLQALHPGVDVELTEIRFSETRQGVRKYLLDAASATYSARGISSLKRIVVVFFDASGRETMRLRADEGDLSGNEQLVNLRGDVVLTGVQGFILRTDHLTYSKADDRLQTDAKVIIESAQGVLRGRGLLAFPQKERLKLLYDVSGEFGAKMVELKPKRGH